MKRTPKRQKQEIVIIFWTDAAMHGVDQMSTKEAQSRQLVEGIAVGFLVYEDKKRINIALDYFPEDEEYRCVNTYPKSGIKKIVRKLVIVNKE